jgi:NCS1 family nucleobase:cation symporter-1
MAINDLAGMGSSEIFPSSSDYGEGLLPIPKIDRYAGTGLMFWLWCGGNILLTTFVLGGYYAAALGAVGMIVVTFAGGLIGNLFPSLSGLRSARYGVDEYVGMRSTFGTFGAFIGIFLLVAINFGWVGILSSIAGHSGSAALATYHIGNFHWYSIFALGCGIILPVVMLYISPKTVFTLVKFSVPLLILFAFLLLWKQLSHFGWHEISMIKPNHSVSWQYAIEANIAYAVSWFPYMGAWNRFAKTEKGAFWGAWIGLSFIAILFAIVGGIATLTTGSGDPSVWAAKSGLGVPALLIIILSTLINNAMLLYCSAMGIKTAFPKANYHWVVGLVALPSIVFIYQGTLQNNFSTILTVVGAVISPYWGVALGDYFLLRRQHVDLIGLYQGEGGPYWFKRGFNPVALGVWIAGMAMWLFLGGWTSYVSWLHFGPGEKVFTYLTATAPVIIFCARAYWGLGMLGFSTIAKSMPETIDAVTSK